MSKRTHQKQEKPAVFFKKKAAKVQTSNFKFLTTEDQVKLYKKIIQDLKDPNNNGIVEVATCSYAPAYGWSKKEYDSMPKVAKELRENGYSVVSSCVASVWTYEISKDF